MQTNRLLYWQFHVKGACLVSPFSWRTVQLFFTDFSQSRVIYIRRSHFLRKYPLLTNVFIDEALQIWKRKLENKVFFKYVTRASKEQSLNVFHMVHMVLVWISNGVRRRFLWSFLGFLVYYYYYYYYYYSFLFLLFLLL